MPDKETGIELLIAKDIAEVVANMVRIYCVKIEEVGSLRREKPVVNDIDFVVLTNDLYWQKIKDIMVSANAKLVCAGNKILRVLKPEYYGDKEVLVQIDFYRATEETYGITKLIRTGSEEHNIWLAKEAIKKGMRLLYSKGLVKDGEVIAGKDEKEVFEALGLEYIVPPEREVVNGKSVWMK
jgi:DNA polymerase/3'-5' exonuclease PolX